MNKTRIVAESGMLSALSLVLLFFGSILEVLDLSMAVIAGLAVIAMRIRHGRVGAIAVYCTCTALAFLLLPNKVPAFLYMFYGGLYPLIKPEIERLKNRVLTWVLKVLVVLVSFSIALGLIRFFIGTDAGFTIGAPLYILLAVVAVCADIAISGTVARFGNIIAVKKR